MKEPKDLGVKIGSKKQVYLEKAITQLEESILQIEVGIELDKENLISLKKKLEVEIENFK